MRKKADLEGLSVQAYKVSNKSWTSDPALQLDSASTNAPLAVQFSMAIADVLMRGMTDS